MYHTNFADRAYYFDLILTKYANIVILFLLLSCHVISVDSSSIYGHFINYYSWISLITIDSIFVAIEYSLSNF